MLIKLHPSSAGSYRPVGARVLWKILLGLAMVVLLLAGLSQLIGAAGY